MIRCVAWLLLWGTPLLLVSMAGTFRPALAEEATSLELGDGERMVLLGATLIERMQQDGYLETSLASQFPGRKFTVRNLGWSGDTVNVQMRPLNFGSLEEHVKAAEPTVVLVNYGGNESFAGRAGLESFVAGYAKILDMLEQIGARVVMITPNRHENLGPPLPDPARHNRQLELYSEATRKLAAERGHRLIDLFETLPDGTNRSPPRPLTDNGIHLTDYGNWRAATVMTRELGLRRPAWRVELDEQGRVTTARGTSVDDVQRTAEAIRFRAEDRYLPRPANPRESSTPTVGRTLTIGGLAPGSRWTLSIDGAPITEASAEQWSQGVTLAAGPEYEQVEDLRRHINRKNQLFFYRWRAHNSEYIIGRRAAPTGRGPGEGNSGNPQFPAEFRQLEELIAAEEATIAELAVPRPHVYELKAR